MKEKTKLAYTKLGKALESLKVVLQIPNDPLRVNIDVSIQRFEFCVELFWKALKCIIEELGKETNFPKEVLRLAYSGHLIENESLWLKMLEDRNNTSHTYNEKLADQIYANIKEHYYSEMEKTYQKLFSTLNNTLEEP